MGLTTRFADRHWDQLGAVRAKLTPKGAPETGAVNLTAHEIEVFDDPAAPGAHRSVRSSWLMTPATLRVGLAEGGQDRPPGGIRRVTAGQNMYFSRILDAGARRSRSGG
jgi:hypothetical protein